MPPGIPLAPQHPPSAGPPLPAPPPQSLLPPPTPGLHPITLPTPRTPNSTCTSTPGLSRRAPQHSPHPRPVPRSPWPRPRPGLSLTAPQARPPPRCRPPRSPGSLSSSSQPLFIFPRAGPRRHVRPRHPPRLRASPSPARRRHRYATPRDVSARRATSVPSGGVGGGGATKGPRARPVSALSWAFVPGTQSSAGALARA